MFRNFKTVPYLIFGRGCFNQLDDILSEKRSHPGPFMVFLVDEVFSENSFRDRIPLNPETCSCGWRWKRNQPQNTLTS